MSSRIGIIALAAIAGTAFMSTRETKGANDEQPPAAARSLLQALPESKRSQAQLPFESAERVDWNYVPMKRAGVPLADLDASQKTLVDSLLSTALSPQALETAKGIIQHELILREIEGGAPRRDPGLYYTVVFGEPGPRAPWAWRFEGHHLSVNATNVEGQRQVVAPLFMGSNPARVQSGPKAGLRLLAAEEDLARALIKMFPGERRARAMLSNDAFSDIVTRNDPKVRPFEMEGLAASNMTQPEQEQLRKLLQVYANRLTEPAARDQLDRIERAGFGKVHFGWAGSIEPGKPHYYRLHGPTVLIEYDNTQNNANHIHTVWRDLERDFGGDLLRSHYEQHRRAGTQEHEH
jgi:hypothetical protein